MRLFLSAGEPSGDQRAAEVLLKLKELSKTPVEAFGFGGSELEASGMEVIRDLSSYAVMGFGEILGSLHRFLRLECDLAASCAERPPDAAVLVDYPGFNLRLGKRLRKIGIPVVQYVAPQMWAWGGWRTKKLKRSCDLLLTLFAFEKEFFEKRGIRTVFTGHPLVTSIQAGQGTGKLLGILPGSREQEVRLLLAPMIRAFRMLRRSGVISEAVLAVSNHVDRDLYSKAEAEEGIRLVNGTREALACSRAALVCSGTATLETALHGVPFVVCYRTGLLSYALARLLVHGVRRIGMANIVAGTDVAPELIQNEVTPEMIAGAVTPLIVEGKPRNDVLKGLQLVRKNLGSGDPALNAAREILSFVNGAE